MNILVDDLPNAIRVNGIEISVHTDFRIWIRVGKIIRESDGRDVSEVISELAELSLENPSDLDKIDPADFVTAISTFYMGFPRLVGAGGKDTKVQRKENFDFEADAEFIYSSFALCYHVRLVECEMHWWEFLILFDGLMFAEDNAMSLVVGTRQTDLRNVPKTEKRRISKLKKEFALPQDKKELSLQAALAANLSTAKKDSEGSDGE